MTAYTTRPLDPSTWDAFADLVERNNGIYGGCWCIAFHREWRRGQTDPRTHKERLVREGLVDKRHRGQGVGRAAVEAALQQIAAAGGGLVEAISETTAGRKAQARFLSTATVELLEQLGFARVRQVGKHAWIVSRSVEADGRG